MSPPSKVEGVVTASTGGESFLGGGATLLFGEDTYIYRGEFEVAEFPEHIFGIGNSVSMADREEITSKHCSTANQLLHRVGPNLFVGGVLNLADYYDMVKEEGSFLDRQEVTGRDGGVSLGLGATLINDSRDYRHNPLTSSFIHPSATLYSSTSAATSRTATTASISGSTSTRGASMSLPVRRRPSSFARDPLHRGVMRIESRRASAVVTRSVSAPGRCESTRAPPGTAGMHGCRGVCRSSFQPGRRPQEGVAEKLMQSCGSGERRPGRRRRRLRREK